MPTFLVDHSVQNLYHKADRYLDDEGTTQLRNPPNSQAKHNRRTREVEDIMLSLTGWSDLDQAILNWKGPKSLQFLVNEFHGWFDDPSVNPSPAYKFAHNEETWKEAQRHGRYYYTYAERIHKQWPYLVREMRDNPYTRQGFLSIWQPDDIVHAGAERVPCTIGYLFRLGKTLNDEIVVIPTMIMRSTDLQNCLLNDIWLGINLARKLADQLVLPGGVGMFNLFTTNLHKYV